MLRYLGSFSTCDIEKLTWHEAEDYLICFNKREDYKLKLLTIRIVESLTVTKGKPDAIRRYVNKITESDEPKESRIEDQFKGVDFGE